MTNVRTTAIETAPQERGITPRRPTQAITLRSVQSQSEASGSHEDGVTKDRIPENHVCAGTALGFAIAAAVAGLLLVTLLLTFLLARVGLVLALVVTVWVWAFRKLFERFHERENTTGTEGCCVSGRTEGPESPLGWTAGGCSARREWSTGLWVPGGDGTTVRKRPPGSPSSSRSGERKRGPQRRPGGVRAPRGRDQ
jgi:hypothetical protein